MEILSVNLKNFKIHQAQQFTFRPGINAICGENGAGKTSIIEALAWVLFDYCSYTKSELIRNGAKSAQAWVSFISQSDGRTYRVHRCTSRGYEIFDPQLQRKLGLSTRNDIDHWLRQQLGIAGGLSLPNLFSEMIGIPQGTFTADFLKSPEGRKKVFDPILRVDDYKDAFQKALGLKNYSQAQLQATTHEIEQCQGELADWENLKTEEQALIATIATSEAQLQTLEEQLRAWEQQRQHLQAQAQHLTHLEQQQERLGLELSQLTQLQTQLQQQLTQAETAAHRCQTHALDYQAYLELAETLTSLEQQLQQRPALEHHAQNLQQDYTRQTNHLSQLELQLDQLATAQAKIHTLEPLLPQQLHLEQSLQSLRIELSTLEQAQTDAELLSQTSASLQAIIDQSQREIHALTALQPEASRLADLETEYGLLQQQRQHQNLNQGLREQLERLLKQAQTQLHELDNLTELAQGYVAAWPGSLLGKHTVETALAQGPTNYRHLLNQLHHLALGLGGTEPTLDWEHQREILSTQLQTARQAQLQLATLPIKSAQLAQHQEQWAQAEKQRQRLQSRLDQLPQLQQQAAELQAQLTTLADPRGQLQHLQAQLAQLPQLQANHGTATQTLDTLATRLQQIQAQLQALGKLEQQRQATRQQQQLHQQGYQTYLQQHSLAQQLPELQAQQQSFQAQQQQLCQRLQALTQELNQQRQAFTPETLEHLNLTIQQGQHQRGQLQGSLPLYQQQRQALQEKLAHRQSLFQQLQALQQTQAKQQVIDDFIQFSRQALNQSGPRITQYYMTSIVQVADQLFRELLDRPDVALAWTEDYEIRVQEEGHWRGFKSLSGGEQMCAALAIRLALLKVLVEIDIAFFDEPTTNMDQTRRRQLAEALGNLRSFQQLFVISHDDAFEQMTETIIRVSRQGI